MALVIPVQSIESKVADLGGMFGTGKVPVYDAKETQTIFAKQVADIQRRANIPPDQPFIISNSMSTLMFAAIGVIVIIAVMYYLAHRK